MKIAIASGKGGTGKTFVSTNLFWAAQKSGINVTLVDCDAEEPNVSEFISGETLFIEPVFQKIPVIDTDQCAFCGKCQEYCNYNAIICLPYSKYITVIEDLCHDCGACFEACEIDAISEKEKLIGVIKSIKINDHATIIEACSEIGVYSPVPVVRKTIEKAGSQSLIILDSPPGISCPFIATVENADFVALVTEPTPFGLNDLKLSVETLEQIKKPFGVIVNRAGLGDLEVYKWLAEEKIPLLMEIQFDKEIARIYSEGKLVVTEIPGYSDKFIELLNTIKRTLKA
jgi:MinD superfamily P-loop ATPase